LRGRPMPSRIWNTAASPSVASPTITSESPRRWSARGCPPRSCTGCAVASDTLLTGSTRGAQGATIDGYVLGERLNAGGAGYVYRATPPAGRDPGFAVVMKLPAVGHGEPSIGVVGFEMELMIH